MTQKSETTLSRSVAIDARGYMELPVEMRQALGLEGGGQVTLKLEKGKIQLETEFEAKPATATLRGKYATPGRSLTEELLAERRKEVEAKGW